MCVYVHLQTKRFRFEWTDGFFPRYGKKNKIVRHRRRRAYNTCRSYI